MKEKVVVGKYTLESLTNGMYSDPLDLYREYIQNAVDSIDLDSEKRHVQTSDYLINIMIDKLAGSITIMDNGNGISIQKASQTLIDIGNSTKDKRKTRGFRGIGRLAGLGYCDQLLFLTSYRGENKRTKVSFDTFQLRRLLSYSNDDVVSIDDVMKRIITIEYEDEEIDNHYFTVILDGVKESSELLNEDVVTNYLLQHAPLPFSNDFHWASTIREKYRMLGYNIPEYYIKLNDKKLFKPYRNSFICDKAKKRKDNICDIEVKPFYRDGRITAILWTGVIGFYGTVLDNQIKGIRVRQGNILIGDKTTCNRFFKEDRFNGWLIGELHVFDSELVVNARRDYFELNEAHYDLMENIIDWSSEKTRIMRKISYERSLDEKRKRIIEADSVSDINDLCVEKFSQDTSESELIDKEESEEVAEIDFITKLSMIINQKQNRTKYMVLNINDKLTQEQKKTLEKIFDIIVEKYSKDEAELFINNIINNF